MNSAERFYAAISGKPVDRIPVVPKIWIDWAAKHMSIDPISAINDPALSMNCIVDAALEMGFDAARLFIFPYRHVQKSGKICEHINENGHPIGTIDLMGGWATRLYEPLNILTDKAMLASYQMWQQPEPLQLNKIDLKHISIPDATYYDLAGYGRMVDEITDRVGDRIGLIGDCNSATLAFYTALRGMEQSLLDMSDEPDLVEAYMDLGVELALSRAKFFVKHGIHILRLNDSVANMSVISPTMFQRFVLPRINSFCSAAHDLSPNVRVYCHICGNIAPILNDLAESGLDCISPLDPLGGFSVAEARRCVGKSVTLMGGVNTFTLQYGSACDVEREALDCIHGADGRFILGSGCVVPVNASTNNLAALTKVVEL